MHLHHQWALSPCVMLVFTVKGTAAGVACFTPVYSHTDSQILTARQAGSTHTSLTQTTVRQIPAGRRPEYQSRVLSCLQGDCTLWDYTHTNDKMTVLIKHTRSLLDDYGYIEFLALTLAQLLAFFYHIKPWSKEQKCFDGQYMSTSIDNWVL